MKKPGEELLENFLRKAVKMHECGALSLSSDQNDLICFFTLDEMDVIIRPFPIPKLDHVYKLVIVQVGDQTVTSNIIHPVGGWPWEHKKVCKFADCLYEHRPINWLDRQRSSVDKNQERMT